MRLSVVTWRRLWARAGDMGYGVEWASWNHEPGLLSAGYVLDLVELGLRAVDSIDRLEVTA